MDYQMSVTYAGGFVEAHSAGEKSYQTALELWGEITRVCHQHNCYKVLGIGRSTRPMPMMDAINHKKLFKDFAVTHKYKIAWVELNREAIDSVKFLELFIQNRSLVNSRLFETVDEAKLWLLAD